MTVWIYSYLSFDKQEYGFRNTSFSNLDLVWILHVRYSYKGIIQEGILIFLSFFFTGNKIQVFMKTETSDLHLKSSTWPLDAIRIQWKLDGWYDTDTGKIILY